MIKYLLKCKDCEQEFESWFGTSDEYDRLLKLKLLNCQSCDSINVEKSLMSPNLLNTKKKENLKELKKYKEVRKKLSDYKKFIKDNFDYVGDDFAFKARSLHYNNKKNKKGIYGTATNKQIKELDEEGIDTQIFPWVENKNN